MSAKSTQVQNVKANKAAAWKLIKTETQIWIKPNPNVSAKVFSANSFLSDKRKELKNSKKKNKKFIESSKKNEKKSCAHNGM